MKFTIKSFFIKLLLIILIFFVISGIALAETNNNQVQLNKKIEANIKLYPELKFYNNGIQIAVDHIIAVLKVIHSLDNPSLLIWGVGNDSKMWCEAGKGKTIFIEDNQYWADKTAKEMPCKIVMVNYETKVKDWNKLLKLPNKLDLNLPDDIKKKKYDVIVVDAPLGAFYEKAPGRMKSIYMSATVLSHADSHVFVDDYNRKVETAYSAKFLKPKFGPPIVFSGRNGFAYFAQNTK